MNERILQRARKSIMDHMLHDNLSIVVTKQLAKLPFKHCFITDEIGDRCLISLRTKELGYFFPLYLYQKKSNPKKLSLSSVIMLFEPQADYGVKKPNLSPAFIEKLTQQFKKPPSPEQIFFYIYAVLYSNIYRTKYAEFLKIDFPRIPFTKDFKLFKKMGDYGEKLVDLHILKSAELDPPIARFQGKGGNKIEKLKYEQDRLYINNGQYFEGIFPEVWEYQVGGYQICEKWLKDRKGCVLPLDDIKHYCKIITALKLTIEIQKDIDNLYPDIEKDLLK